MKKLRALSGPFERRRLKGERDMADIKAMIESNPEFAAVAAKVWEDVTGGDGVLMVQGKPIAPSDPMGVTKDLK